MKKFYNKSSIINYANIIIFVFFRKIFIKLLFVYFFDNNNMLKVRNMIFNKYYNNFRCNKCFMNNYKFLFNEDIDIFQCEYCSSYNIKYNFTKSNYQCEIKLRSISSCFGIEKYKLDIENNY